MEKENIVENPSNTPQESEEKSAEDRLHALLGTNLSTASIPANNKTLRVWTYGKQSEIAARHRQAVRDGVRPEDIKHFAHGSGKGCQCATCKTKRGEFEEKILSVGSTAEAGSVAAAAPVADKKNEQESIKIKPAENFITDLVTADTMAIILDSPRKIGEIYVKGKGYGKNIENIWLKDDEEFKALGLLGKAVLDKYANIPDWPYKEELVLIIMLGQSVGLRVLLMNKMIDKAVKQN